MMFISRRFFFACFLPVLLISCTGTPENIKAISHFSADDYLGTWYEVARLDHSFERGLQQVSANYEKRKDGGIRVINKGYDEDKNTWKEAEGKAYLLADEHIGHLKVSFFGPFYGSYIIFELDVDARDKLAANHGEPSRTVQKDWAKADNAYAFISGHNKNYLWLLARKPQISDALKQRFIEQATALDFSVDELIWVQQTP